MDINLTTCLDGLELKSPLIVGSCPLTTNNLQRISMVNNGVGAIVLPSIFAGKNEEVDWFSTNEFQTRR